MSGEVTQLEVADRQPNDGGLVQLGRDGRRKRKHLGKLIKLEILLSSPRPRSVSALLLPQLQNTGRKENTGMKSMTSPSIHILLHNLIWLSKHYFSLYSDNTKRSANR